MGLADQVKGWFESVSCWTWGTLAYVVLATSTFWPVLKALLGPVPLNPGGASFKDAKHFSEEGKELLEQHFSRIQGTLGFWKKQASKFHRLHIYTVCWTIPASILIPLLIQAVPNSVALVTIISVHNALLLAFHRAFRVESNYRAFRHGESEFYDLYRRMLDRPRVFGKDEKKQIENYFEQVEQVRRFVRTAETDNLPALQEAKKEGSAKPVDDQKSQQ